MADQIASATVGAPGSASLAETTVAVAAVLSRWAGSDRAVISVHAAGGKGGRLPCREVPMPRDLPFGDVLVALTDLLDLNATVSLDVYVTVTVTDPSGRRQAARVGGGPGAVTWNWLTGGSADPAAEDRVRRVLRHARANPATRLRDLPVLTAAERGHHASLAASRASGPGVNVLHALRQHAADRPGDVAIVDGDATMSYAELDRAVARCAAALGPPRDTGDHGVVALILPRSRQLVVAMLGALSAGVAFTVINPATPALRARRLVREVGARLAVAEHVADLPVPVVTPASLAAAGRPDLDPMGGEHAGPAYVLFTSGSTGAPKRVSVSRPALWRYIGAVTPAYGLSPSDRVLQLAEPGFDVMLEEIMPTLAAGGRVVVAGEAWLDSPAHFLHGVREHAVTVVNLPSSLWTTLLRRGPSFLPVGDSVRLMVVGSERVTAPAYLSWYASPSAHVPLVNAYGTTETAITSLVYQPSDRSLDTVRRLGAVPIGTPLPHTRAWVVDSFGDPRPFGRPGELVIGAAARSIADGYRTGDLVHLDSGGAVVHLGRLDKQLKVRGHRIEPAEVEAALESLPAVRRALCTADGGRLVALAVPDSDVEPRAILADLRRILPAWLVPDHLVLTAELPRNHHGKTDPAAAGRVARRASPSTATGAPAALSRTQRVVAQCMSEVVGRRASRPEDNFHSLGGTSLEAIRLVVMLAERLGIEVSARQVLRDPTVAGIAAAVEAASAGPVRGLVRRRARGSFPLTPNQRAMARFLHPSAARSGPSRPFFEMWEALRITGPLDRDALCQAVAALVREHEPLRTVLEPGTMTQRVVSGWVPAITEVDLSGRAGDLDDALEHARRPFDLSATPAFRPVLLRLGAQEHVLSLTFHHLFFDGWSYGLVYERLAEFYTGYAGRSAPARRRVRPEFGDWALRVAGGAAARDDLAYWREVLDGHRPPAVCERVTGTDATCTTSAYTVDEEVSTALEKLAAASSLTPFALLKTLFAVVLAHAVEHRDLVVACSDANRYEPGTERMVGYLATTLLSRFRLRDGERLLSMAGRTQAGLTSARLHTSLQWEDLLAELGLGNAVQFRFSLHDTPSALPRLPGLSVRRLPDVVARRGKRAVAVAVRRRTDGYELRWYARDDAVVVPPSLALRMFETLARTVVARPDVTVAELSNLLASHDGRRV